jgi:hypothetical protein
LIKIDHLILFGVATVHSESGAVTSHLSHAGRQAMEAFKVQIPMRSTRKERETRPQKLPERCLPRAWLEGGCSRFNITLFISIFDNPFLITIFFWRINAMAKYLLLWKLDRSRIPTDGKERAIGWGMLTAMVKNDLEKGLSRDWGAVVGESKGYVVVEGNELDISLLAQQYAPYVEFEIKPVMSVIQVEEMLQVMQG